MRKRSVRDLDVAGKRVLVREDFNVPMQDGQIADETRITAALPTIRYLLNQGAAVILISHLGRPRGRIDPGMSLRPVAERLAELLGCPVSLAPPGAGEDVEAMARQLRPGDVLLLENVRFQPEEEANDEDFARSLARLGDLYVNDAFGSAHRAHASTEGIAHFLPSATGLLMERELTALSGALQDPRRPLAALIGGAKISSKIGVLENLLSVADEFLIGGGMANTFLLARGMEVGASLIELEAVHVAREFLEQARRQSAPVYLPVDVIVAERVAVDAETKVVPASAVAEGWRIVDIGPETVRRFGDVLRRAGTVIWNGPMGVFEIPAFSEGTRALARILAESPADVIVGGGDSVAAVEQAGLADDMAHISTGGGASLEFLEGRELPGVAALDDMEGAA
ncbi:MAG TPA: phosphoglycerate kinase [Chloroflexota bacterium]|nr:phosphoglycerate kinase [Chloroflexota bacterium]